MGENRRFWTDFWTIENPPVGGESHMHFSLKFGISVKNAKKSIILLSFTIQLFFKQRYRGRKSFNV